MWETVIRALSVVGGIGFVGTIVTALAMRRKVRADATKAGADAAKVLGDTAASLVTEVRADMAELRSEHRTEINEMHGEILALRRHVGVLEGLLRRHGIPVPEFARPPTGGA